MAATGILEDGVGQTSDGDGNGKFTIVIGNKNYSSWSLRAWLALEMTGVSFNEVVIPLHRDDTAAALKEHSPSRRVPVLKHGDFSVWDSLAIAEYLADLFPEARLWPRDAHARASARSVAAEMHAGFAALRKQMPMDIRARLEMPAVQDDLAADIARICGIWEECRKNFAVDGDFLFGDPSIADAFFAPVVSRFVTYRPALGKTPEAYVEAVWNWPAMQSWVAAAAEEPWHIDDLRP